MRGLTSKQIEEELEAITDHQVYDSEEGGDDDAEDFLPVESVGSPCKRRRTVDIATLGSADYSGTSVASRCTSKPVCKKTEEKSGDEEVFVDDDSVVDPDYTPRDDLSESSDSSCIETYMQPEVDTTTTNNLPIIIDESSDSDSESELQLQNIAPEFSWRKQGTAPQIFGNASFQQPFGPKININDKSPSEIFFLFFTTAVWQHIVEQSNHYADHDLGMALETTVEEMKAFIGILIIMGFHCLPSMRLYWSNDQNFHVSRVTSVMTLKRFLKLMRCIHLNDNAKTPEQNSPEFDKLFKVRPLLDFLTNSFQSTFNPSRYISIDESMIRYKGRNSMKQYMPMKPIKRGFKVWVAACAVSGFMIGFDVYTGKSNGGNVSLGLGERVVLDLVRMFHHLFYCLFFDNFFTSLPLLKTLLEKGLFACGTIRSTRRHFPKTELKADKELGHSQSDYVQVDDISVYKWMDKGKKAVCVASSMHDPSMMTTAQRTNRDGQKETVPCPEAIASYNKYMCGVDKFDQYLSLYSIGWKSRRWWLRIFYYFVDSSIVNAFIMYQENCKIQKKKHWMSHLEFRSQLANELIGNYMSRKKSGHSPGNSFARKRKAPTGRRTVVNTLRFTDVGSHLPEVGTRRRCAHCSTKKNSKA